MFDTLKKWLPKPKDKPPAPPQAAPINDAITIAVLWCADKCVLLACVLVIAATYIIDVIFFASTGGEYWPIFIMVGLVFRSFNVGSGPMLQALRGRTDLRDTRRTLRSIQIFCFIACLYPPMNFFAASHFEKVSEAAAVTDVASAAGTSKETRIDRQRDRLERAKETRDTSIKSAQDAMAIIKDQVVGTSAADNQTLQRLQSDISKYLDDYRGTEKEINSQIDTIEKEQETVATESAEAKATTHETWPVFLWLGEQFPWWGASSHLVWANWSLFGFAMLIEYCALLALGAYIRAHGFFQAMLEEMKAKTKGVAPVEIVVTPALSTSPDQPSPQDLPADAATPTPQQVNGKKGGDATKHKKAAAAANDHVPVDDWSARATGA